MQIGALIRQLNQFAVKTISGYAICVRVPLFYTVIWGSIEQWAMSEPVRR